MCEIVLFDCNRQIYLKRRVQQGTKILKVFVNLIHGWWMQRGLKYIVEIWLCDLKSKEEDSLL